MNGKAWRRFWLPIYIFLCCSLLPLQAWLGKPVHSHAARPRRLVIVLDGVPYQTIAELQAEGRFKHFKQPARMISTFPSLTNPAMIEILHEADSPGYEDHYYDRERNRLAGTIQDRLRGERFIRGTFRETFDYHAPAFKGALGYVAAPMGAIALAQFDLAGFRAAFEQSKAPMFIGYIGETDSLAHLGGEAPLKNFLRTLDRAVNELIEESGGQLEVEMFSDHGNRFDGYREVKLNDALKAAGFVIEKSVAGERSVVMPRHGLVGSSMLFTQDGNRVRLAESCAAVTGVDFAVYQSVAEATTQTIELVSRRGRARISRAGERFKYEDRGGDPLRLNTIALGVARDADGFAAREAWWWATRGHLYADPLRRLFDGFNAHVQSRADVIVSYEDGYLLGSPLLSHFAQMRATHGNLLRGESEGFAISTRQTLSETVRGFELHRLFALNERAHADSYFSGAGHCQIGPALARSLRATNKSVSEARP